jgi:hypothetical protein
MATLTLPLEIANAILQYLGTRPWVEVNGLITAMQEEAKKQGLQPAPSEPEQPSAAE